ncbi:3',5'-cyclic-AMP phosphodiesterase [Vibrio sp. TH_r3]|uniref:3',5'-cyclic-AMP phosphodiesterase n=1 Tax=Vibrio sp. TH_r3 TaxID=3082084 RepID=UPI002955185C|nr:3',5'-cyclic-AMP phosphodiesterase [Vibrio sp. TH_r3]MDV7104534.1 3',5'-cyclic-AMP phosphodiesterase [Vibrio sp. TH_r3]
MKISAAVKNDSISVLQITDPHLFSEADGCLLGVNTLDSFHAVIEEIKAQDIEFDAVFATGDISQDHSIRSYQRFEQGITQLGKPCFWLPGNHDFRLSMDSIIPSENVYDNTHLLAGEHWQVILLDSQVSGVPHGRLSESQLTFLDSQLAQNESLHTLVLIHHHPVLVGSEWLDQHTLHNADMLWNIVAKHNNVKAILGGHVHQDFNQLVGNTRVMTTPSTCVQFKPNSKDFALDTVSPGWRVLQLFPDGKIETKVQRLANGKFTPDFTAGGY